jgi:predicted dehydrogenase
MNGNFNIVTRRKFIQTTATAALAAPLILQSCTTENKILRHACVGVGGMMGLNDLQNFVSHPQVQVVAICDVDNGFLQKALEIVPEARIYSDWREMFEKEAENIDSVNVTVPDHNHFIIAYNAIEMEKHVYCQKPMCHDVAEVRLLTEASVKYNVKTQLGTQYASSQNDRRAVQLIKEGVIGKVKHVYLCSNRPGAEKYRLAGPRPVEGAEPPAYLNWDVWIGPAPLRNYVPDLYHTVMWRSWLDFGTGWSGDIGCHIFDAVWKGLGLTAPKNVIAKVQQSWQESPERRADTWPQSNHIKWTFPGNGFTETNELPIEWFDGEFYPPQEVQALFHGDKYPPESAMLVGTEGALLVAHGNDLVLLPHDKFSNHKIPDFKERNHYHHFVDACLGGENTESHFAQSGPMTEAILLGTVAARVPDVLLEWDSENLKITNSPEANQLISRNYRKGWNVAGF